MHELLGLVKLNSGKLHAWIKFGLVVWLLRRSRTRAERGCMQVVESEKRIKPLWLGHAIIAYFPFNRLVTSFAI